MRAPADILRDARISKGYATAADAARAHGWNSATYTSHENGTRGIRQDAARRYARAFGLSESELLGVSQVRTRETTTATAPVIGEARVGVWMDSELTGQLSLDRTDPYDGKLEKIIIVADDGETMPFAVLVADDSINLRIERGSYAICREVTDITNIADDSLVYVERKQNGLVEKSIRIFKNISGTHGILKCDSNNPNYKDTIELDPSENDVQILARVIGMCSIF